MHAFSFLVLAAERTSCHLTNKLTFNPGPVTWSDARPPRVRMVAGRSSGPTTSFRHLEIGHEIISTAILSLPLIQVGAIVSYWRKDVHLVLVNHLGSLPRNSLIRLTDRLDMAIVVDWNVKPRTKQKQGRAMVLGSFQCRGVLLLRQMTRQGPAVLAAGAEWVGYVLFFYF